MGLLIIINNRSEFRKCDHVIAYMFERLHVASHWLDSQSLIEYQCCGAWTADSATATALSITLRYLFQPNSNFLVCTFEVASFPGLPRLLIASSDLKKQALNPKTRLKAWGGLGTRLYSRLSYNMNSLLVKSTSQCKNFRGYPRQRNWKNHQWCPD